MADYFDDVSYEEWLRYVFDYHKTNPDWYRNHETDAWDGASPQLVAALTTLFTTPTLFLAPYSNAQVNDGLRYIITGLESDYIYSLLDPAVPLLDRLRCIRSFLSLFEQLFSIRCTPRISYYHEITNPLNAICFMWWDILPIYGQPHNPAQTEIDATILAVMRQTLRLPHIACHESALHGLGHWHHNYPKEVEHIIDTFLANNADLTPELKTYALDAKRGSIQ